MQKTLKKKGQQFGVGIIVGVILAVILVTILFSILAELMPVAQTAGDTLNASGVPLGNLFSGNGVIFLIIMASVLLIVVLFFLKGLTKGSK